MEITDPKTLLQGIDMSRLNNILGVRSAIGDLPQVEYVEPGVRAEVESSERLVNGRASAIASSADVEEQTEAKASTRSYPSAETTPQPSTEEDNVGVQQLNTDTSTKASNQRTIVGKVSLLGDFIDTDALAPNEALIIPNVTKQQLGEHCLKYTHPEFRKNVRELGHNIVVAGEGFGCGSSRENAVTALQGAGVQCVIAKSFAFIYGRNQPNLGMLGIEMRDERFWQLVAEGTTLRVDLNACTVGVEEKKESWEQFPFQLSPLQRRLFECGGAANAFGKWGKALFEALCASEESEIKTSGIETQLQNISKLSISKERKKIEW
jgi:3-isopropylmalate dehydratase small subunit